MMTEEMNILIVDDEKRVLDTVSFMLEEMNFHVRTASSEAETMSLLQKQRFDIAFLDQNMGSTNGIDLMEKMQAIDQNMYFVIITGTGTADLAVESLKRGASDFLSKPFFVADMIKSIDHVNRKREIDREKKEMVVTLTQKVEEKEVELKKLYFSVLSSLAQAMEKKDIGTYGHSRRVSHISKLIATALDLSEEERENIKVAALLHDIGKIGISDFILGKTSSLNQNEADIVKSHPQKGVEILKPLKQFQSTLPAILHHHEKYDGTGYPNGLKADEIPLHARIIAIADTYDAILSNRPYRSGKGHEMAITELIRCSGSQFDPVIVNAFVIVDRKYNEMFADVQNSGG